MSNNKVDPVIAEFVQRDIELANVVRRRSSNQLIDPEQLNKFALELGNFHVHQVDTVVQHFDTNLEEGLARAKAKYRQGKDGPNVVEPPKEFPLWLKFVLCFFSGFAPLLWVAILLVFLSWEPFGTPPSNLFNLILAIVLIIVVVSSSIFSFYQEMQATKILEAFRDLVPTTCIVLRSEKLVKVQAAELVVGDVVILSHGSKVPADIRITESKQLKVDKSMFTGESEPVKLTAEIEPETVTLLSAANMAFMGTSIVEGEGRGIVIATGKNTQLNKIVQGASGRPQQTSLQKDIDRLVSIVGSFALITGVVVVLVWAFRIRVYHPTFMTVSSMIANTIGVVVAYVPEGLPLALSVGLTIVARRLCLNHNVLVKRLAIIETVGSMSFLGSDKTGTLTMNEMTVTNLLSAINIEEGSAAVDGNNNNTTESTLQALHFESQRIATLCNQSSLQPMYSNPTASKGKKAVPGMDVELALGLKNPKRDLIIGGNATDQALMIWASDSDEFQSFDEDYMILCRVPFSSRTKTSIVVVRNLKNNERYIMVKGAPEYILQSCTHYLDGNMSKVSITEEFTNAITNLIETEAAKGARMVALAQMGPLDKNEFPLGFEFYGEPKPNFPTNRLTFVSCVAVSDPPKPGVREAIETMQDAGIIVAMITGDSAPTAIAIAREVHIITDPTKKPNTLQTLKEWKDAGKKNIEMDVKDFAVAVVGKDLDFITQEQWDFIFLHREMVFARTTPEQKLMIVEEAKKRGHRVGVTGDGINDSPALKNADVGIAMKDGAEVARDAAAIILLDNDFTSVVHAVCEGRLIFMNLRRVIGYQISCGCWAELLPVLATFFIGLPQPLNSFVMIIICCFSDVFGGIALMNEPPENDIMKQPPRDLRTARLLDWKLVSYAYLFYANMASIGAFYTYFMYMAERGPDHAVPTPIPADDDGSRSFPAGYRAGQLIGAWNWGANTGDLGADQALAANVGSSVFYVCLVTAQMAHVLSIRRKTPYFWDAIMNTKNQPDNVLVRIWDELITSEIRWPILYAWCGAILVTNFINYVPVFNDYCGTGPVPGRYWGMAIGWAVLWFTIAEVRKWIVKLFPGSMIAEIDW